MNEVQLFQNEVLLAVNRINIITLRLSVREFVSMYNFALSQGIHVHNSLANRMEDYVSESQLQIYDLASEIKRKQLLNKWLRKSLKKDNHKFDITLSEAVVLCKMMQHNSNNNEEQNFFDKLYHGLINYGFSANYLKINN